MKKLFLLGVILAIGFLNTEAQVRVGLVGGLLSSDFKVESIDGGLDGKLRPSFGASFDYCVQENIFVNAKVLYQTVYAEGGSALEDIDLEFNAKFLELPITLKYEFGKTVNPYLMMGVNLAYNLDADVKFTMNNVDFDGDFSEQVKDITFGILFGGGVSYKLPEFSLFLEGSYMIGTDNILRAGEYEITSSSLTLTNTVDDNDVVKLRNINVLAGIMIPLGL